MNREIIFRAKQPHNGEWMEGYFSKDYAGVSYITTLDGASTGVVDESTLGQFTGLTDKDGVKIWEGDVMKMENVGWEYTIVGYANGAFAFFTTESNYLTPMIPSYWEEGEIIGNRFDNPELTKQS